MPRGIDDRESAGLATSDDAKDVRCLIDVDLEAVRPEGLDELGLTSTPFNHPVLVPVLFTMLDCVRRLSMAALGDEHPATWRERGRHLLEHAVDVCVGNVLEEENATTTSNRR